MSKHLHERIKGESFAVKLQIYTDLHRLFHRHDDNICKHQYYESDIEEHFRINYTCLHCQDTIRH